jgi:hypothetical protein
MLCVCSLACSFNVTTSTGSCVAPVTPLQRLLTGIVLPLIAVGQLALVAVGHLALFKAK